MSDYKTFSKTVKGYLHGVNGLPLEDASICYSEGDPQDGEFYIAAVADGHGDPACVRSERGAWEAVTAARDCLMDFAREALKKEPGEAGEPRICEKLLLAKSTRDGEEILARQSRVILRQLTDTIISRWYDALEADIEKDPFSSEEMAAAGIDEESCAIANKCARICAHAYGTTLVAALMLPDLLLLIQQGDGLCEVFYEEGADVAIERPIPLDDRCFRNMTSSLCDLDAAERIRAWVLDLRDKKIIACYLSSDGVENSFADADGIHMFYRRLSCEFLCGEREEEDWKKLLTDLSTQGSGDDVSVSGIYSCSRLCKHRAAFRMQLKRYELEQKLAEYEDRKGSMRRKYEILHKRTADAAADLDRWQKQIQSCRMEYAKTSDALKEIDFYMNQLANDTRQIRYAIDASQNGMLLSVEFYLWEYDSYTGRNKRRKQRLYPYAHITFKKYREQLLQVEQKLNSAYEQQKWRRDRLAKRLAQLEKAENTEKSRLESQFKTAQAEYADYDRDYQSLETQITAIREQIAALEQDERANILPEAEEISNILSGPDEMLTPQIVQSVQPEEQSILGRNRKPLNPFLKKDGEEHIGNASICPLNLPHFDAES